MEWRYLLPLKGFCNGGKKLRIVPYLTLYLSDMISDLSSKLIYSNSLRGLMDARRVKSKFTDPSGVVLRSKTGVKKLSVHKNSQPRLGADHNTHCKSLTNSPDKIAHIPLPRERLQFIVAAQLGLENCCEMLYLASKFRKYTNLSAPNFNRSSS